MRSYRNPYAVRSVCGLLSNLRCPEWPCDTPFAIEPKLYRAEQELVPVFSTAFVPNGLLNRIVQVANETGAENICLTGGEPMLQSTRDLEELIYSLVFGQRYEVEMFSNGTLPYTKRIMSLCSIRMDWKLPGSGEDSNNERRIDNYDAMSEWPKHTIKFTVKDVADFEEAMRIYDKHGMDAWPGTIYVGPVWGSDFSAADIVAGILANRLPWRLNLQTHQYVWPANERRR